MHGRTPMEYPSGSDPYWRNVMMDWNATGSFDVRPGLAAGNIPLSYFGPREELQEGSQSSQAEVAGTEHPREAESDAVNRPLEDAVNRHLEVGSDGVNGHGRKRATRGTRGPRGARRSTDPSVQQGAEETNGALGSPTTTRRRQQPAARRRPATNRRPAAVDIAPVQPPSMTPVIANHQSGPSTGSSLPEEPGMDGCQVLMPSTGSSNSPTLEMPRMDGNQVLTPSTGSSNSSTLDIPSMDSNLTSGPSTEPSPPSPLRTPNAESTTDPAMNSPSLSFLEMLNLHVAQQLLLQTAPTKSFTELVDEQYELYKDTH